MIFETQFTLGKGQGLPTSQPVFESGGDLKTGNTIRQCHNTVALPILACTLNWRRTAKKRGNHNFKKLSGMPRFVRHEPNACIDML